MEDNLSDDRSDSETEMEANCPIYDTKFRELVAATNGVLPQQVDDFGNIVPRKDDDSKSAA